jgi:tRNA threonylcarbamoyl adenosine modification protein YeaZ
VLLAIDTATPAVTVAVHDGRSGGDVLAARSVVDARAHTERLAPLIAEALRAAGASPPSLTGIAEATGPGPFTGLRVGLVTARALGHVTGAPVVGVCSLDVLAAEAAAGGTTGEFVVVTDARRREVYAARYRASQGRLGRVAGPVVVAPGAVATDLPAVGAGALVHQDLFPAAQPPQYPSAGWLARAVADGVVAVGAPEPRYLRRPDARPPGPPRPVRSGRP